MATNIANRLADAPREWREKRDRFFKKELGRARALRIALAVIVVAPTLLASVYYGLVASKRYVSEASFIVRGVSSHRPNGFEALFQTFGISRAVDDSNAVQQYMLSRDAARALMSELPLREMFSRPQADVFARYPYRLSFWRSESFERLFDYYLDHVTVVQNVAKGLTTLTVVTFDAEDSRKIAKALLRRAEEMVNRMNMRAQNDAVRSAENDLALAERRVIEAQRDLTGFRNRELLIDPSKNSLAVLDTISKLSDELTRTIARIEETVKTAPSNPAIPASRAKAAALENQIASERAKLAGRDGALAPKVAEYEQLALARELAEKALAGASASLERARQEARRQQIYIEEVVPPNLPDEAIEPKRMRSIATVFVLSLVIVAVLWILTAGAQEHAH